jgi:hypothetical protein
MSGAKVGIIPERGDTLKMDIVTIFTALLCRSSNRTEFCPYSLNFEIKSIFLANKETKI